MCCHALMCSPPRPACGSGHVRRCLILYLARPAQDVSAWYASLPVRGLAAHRSSLIADGGMDGIFIAEEWNAQLFDAIGLDYVTRTQLLRLRAVAAAGGHGLAGQGREVSAHVGQQ